MSTEAGFETLPSDGPKTCPGGLYEWMRNEGATIVKIRSNGPCDPAQRDLDYHQVCEPICNGLKVLTRPGWDEGVRLTDFCAAEAPIHRFYDVIGACVGYGNHKPHWFGHIVANEPDNTDAYRNNPGLFKEDLKQYAQKVVNNGWQWIGFVTPPCINPVDPGIGAFYQAIIDAFNEAPDTMTAAFTYLGFHIYWTADWQRDDQISKAVSSFAQPIWNITQARGKYLPLVIDEFSVNPENMNSCYGDDYCLRHASMRHFVYEWACGLGPTNGHRAAAVIKFIITGDGRWTKYSEGSCSGNCDGLIGAPAPGESRTYSWMLEPRGWC